MSKSIAQMSNEELLEAFDENPKNFLSSFARQIRAGVMAEITQQEQWKAKKKQRQELDSKVLDTHQKFADENPEFMKLYKSGELEDFIDKNPGHNAISAFLEINSQRKVDQAVEEALSAKPEPRENPALSDTKEAGGLAQVLYERITSQREAGGPAESQEPEDTGALVETVPETG